MNTLFRGRSIWATSPTFAEELQKAYPAFGCVLLSITGAVCANVRVPKWWINNSRHTARLCQNYSDTPASTRVNSFGIAV